MNKFIIGGIIILAVVGMLIIFYISKPKSKDDRCLDDSDCIKGLSCIGNVCSDKCKATGSDCNAAIDTCCGANGACVGNICIDCVSPSGSCKKNGDCCSGGYCDNNSKTCMKQDTCSQTTCKKLSDCCSRFNSCLTGNCSTTSIHTYIFDVQTITSSYYVHLNGKPLSVNPFTFTSSDTDTITIDFYYLGKSKSKIIQCADIIKQSPADGSITITFNNVRNEDVMINITDVNNKLLLSLQF